MALAVLANIWSRKCRAAVCCRKTQTFTMATAVHRVSAMSKTELVVHIQDRVIQDGDSLVVTGSSDKSVISCSRYCG